MAIAEQHNGDGLYLRLEVAPTASQVEITRAYRRLAHGAHPDAHPDDPGASRRFRELTAAYEVLGDPARRARYDADRARGRSLAARRPATRYPAEPSVAGPGASRPTPAYSPLSRSADAGAPVFIGTVHRPAPSALLWAGPVHVEPPPPRVASALGEGDYASEPVPLLPGFLAPWGWY
jgi:curved DNA-binding protein CbpA